MEKLYLLQDFSSGKLRHCQIAKNSKHPLQPIWQILSYSLTTTGNLLFTQEETFMDSIVIWKWLDIRKHWPLHIIYLIVLVLHLPSTMIQTLSIQLLQIYAWDRRVFSNNVEGFYTRLMPSSVALNLSHQVLEEIWINSTHFMVKKQLSH